MKIKQHLHITEPEMFLRGDYGWAFSIYPHISDTKGYIYCGEIELDVNPDTGAMIEVVSEQIDEKISELKTAIQVAENRKAELLALPAPCKSDTWDTSEPYPDEPGFEDEQSRDDIAAEENRVMDSQR